MHFCECLVYLGYGPTPGPTLKRPCVAFVWLVGRMIDISGFANSRQYLL